MAKTTDEFAAAKSGLVTINRRQVLGGVFAGAAVTALPACSAPVVTADRTVDVVLIGGGIMSATMGVLLRQLEPGWTIEMFERLDGVARESSNAWNNAGTGHSALCELNYTSEGADGTIDVSRALKVNEAFQVSRQFWTAMVERGVLKEPTSFINPTPHMSFVWGEENVDFLRRRHAALTAQPLFTGMEFSTDPAKIKDWAPLLIEGRDPAQPIAATWSSLGTDVDFGSITRQYVEHLKSGDHFALNLSSEVEAITREADGTWLITYGNLADGTPSRAVKSRFVFIGGGGASILLLQESEIPEADTYGGFPVGGSFLVNRNPDVAATHLAKAYGKAASGAPPMSVPHLDARTIDGKRVLLFGPFATFSTNFLMEGSNFDLFSSIQMSNIKSILDVGLDEFGLVQYLVGQVLLSQEDRIEALREYYPQAVADEWELVQAGQRVQIIKQDEGGRGDLQFGTEVVVSTDNTIAALLGASPGGSTSPSILIEALDAIFPEKFASPEWQARLREFVPSLGTNLNEHPAQLAESWAKTSAVLKLAQPPVAVQTPA